MTNKTLPLLFAACLCASTLFPAHAQEAFDFDDIDSLLEENTLTDVSNRYAAVLQAYLPEKAARLGYVSAADKLNVRSAQAEGQTLRALKNVQQQLKEVNVKNLSQAKQADFELLQNAVNADVRNAELNRTANDPLYYTEAFDAVYDVFLSSTLSPAAKRAALTARLGALEQTAAQAEKNLSKPSAFLARLAMEKAYYMHLSLDEITDALLENVQDDDTITQTKRQGAEAKRAVKRMFDLFKRLSQAEDGQDFRLGEEAYAQLLQQQYQIEETPAKLSKNMEENTREARKHLSAALEPFLEGTAEEEVMVVDVLNGDPSAKPQKPAKRAKKKTKKGKPVTRNAQDFYAVAKRTAEAVLSQDYVKTVKQQAAEAASLFAKNGVFSAPGTDFSVRPLPQFYAYTQASALRLPYANLGAYTPEFLLRLPAGNRLARQEQIKRDFNQPTLKLTVSRDLFPGGYYQNAAGKNWSVWRKNYPSATSAAGWKEYAKQTAKEQHYLITDDELAFFAWDEYRRALAAELDVKLQTKRFSYADALEYLTQENGFDQADAEEMLKELAAAPGAAVSRQYGLKVWQNAREKFRKKQGKKFNMEDFHQKALQTGNVTPDKVEKELSRLYEKDKKKKKKDLF